VNHLTFLAYHHAYGWTDWLAQVAVSSLVHALIYSLVFRLMHHLTPAQAAVLVVVVLGCLFMWTRSRDKRAPMPSRLTCCRSFARSRLAE
jgi:hypothetical protein